LDCNNNNNTGSCSCVNYSQIGVPIIVQYQIPIILSEFIPTSQFLGKHKNKT